MVMLCLHKHSLGACAPVETLIAPAAVHRASTSICVLRGLRRGRRAPARKRGARNRIRRASRPEDRAMNIEQARFNMIEQQIRPWDVLDPARAVAAGGGQARRLRAAGATARWPSSTPRCRCRGTARSCWRRRSRRGCCRSCRCAPRARARDRRRLGLHGRAAGAPGAAGDRRFEIDARAGAHGRAEPAPRRRAQRARARGRRLARPAGRRRRST